MTPRIVVSRAGGPKLAPAMVRELARRVRRAARAMGCREEQIDGIELRVVGDDEMAAIKAEHFGVAEPTDVLSFPAGEAVPIGPGPEPDEEGDDDPRRVDMPGGGASPLPGLGEIVLNRDAVARQAGAPGDASWADEATSLLIHGVAHLLGHDHHQRRAARRMRAVERRGCRAVGLPCVRPYGGS